MISHTPRYKIEQADEIRKQVDEYLARGKKIEVTPLSPEPTLRCPAGAQQARYQRYGNRNTI